MYFVAGRTANASLQQRRTHRRRPLSQSPVARAANGLLADTVRALLANLPDDRRLRVLEVGAGTGSATASVLPELPEGRFDYT